MRRLAAAVQPQRVQRDFLSLQQLHHLFRALTIRAVIAPRADDELRTHCSTDDGQVIAGSDRIARSLHVVGVGRAPAEQVGDDQRAEAPALGVETRTRARGVELHFVGGARIEHQKVHHRTLGPLAP
jgi:hypothetical protein